MADDAGNAAGNGVDNAAGNDAANDASYDAGHDADDKNLSEDLKLRAESLHSFLKVIATGIEGIRAGLDKRNRSVPASVSPDKVDSQQPQTTPRHSDSEQFLRRFLDDIEGAARVLPHFLDTELGRRATRLIIRNHRHIFDVVGHYSRILCMVLMVLGVATTLYMFDRWLSSSVKTEFTPDLEDIQQKLDKLKSCLNVICKLIHEATQQTEELGRQWTQQKSDILERIFEKIEENIAVANVIARYTEDTVKKTESQILSYQSSQLAQRSGIAFTVTGIATSFYRHGILNERWSASFALCGTLPLLWYLFFPSREIRDLFTDLKKMEIERAHLNEELAEFMARFKVIKSFRRESVACHECSKVDLLKQLY